MPDEVNIKITVEDQATPVINKIQSDLDRAASGTKNFGSAVEHAGSEMGALHELMGGIGYQIGLWNVGFMAAEKAIDAVGNVISVTIPDINDYRHYINMVGDSASSAAAAHTDLRATALETWTSIGETQKREMSFIEHGWTPQAADDATRMIQRQIHDTGEDLGEAYQKAKEYGAGIGDALKVGLVHQRDRPEIQEEALSDLRRQNLLKFNQFDLEMRQKTNRRAYEDQLRWTSQEREDRQELARYEMEDRHRVTEYQLEDSQHVIQHETELRNIATEREMSDRHRVSQQAEFDTERGIERQTSAATSMRGALESMITGEPMEGEIPFGVMGRMAKVQMAVPEGVQRVLRPQIEAGFAQLQKDLGIDRETATFMIRAGMMPAGTLIQETASVRRSREIAAQRQREAEDREVSRRILDQLLQQNETLYNERRDSNRDIASENIDQARSQHQENKAATRAESFNQQQMARENQDDVDAMRDEGLKRDMRRQELLQDQYQRDLEESAKIPRPDIMGGAGMMGEPAFGPFGNLRIVPPAAPPSGNFIGPGAAAGVAPQTDGQVGATAGGAAGGQQAVLSILQRIDANLSKVLSSS